MMQNLRSYLRSTQRQPNVVQNFFVRNMLLTPQPKTVHYSMLWLVTVKNTTRHRKTERTSAKQRVEFWQLVQGILAKDLIFIDESGVNLSMVRLFARSPKGQRAYGTRPQNEAKCFSY
ncbi:MAG: hypothetical protein CLLPBCKN_001308 [Chroococcidiopsis cubana SAG 39.79]|uniref:hypothetical protein n=1 Tax=Chroococcidiopsis cubana TaxID=171392 RepID=UPI002AC54CA1|nr:hypothetical protein [Chroococcidiopsis cubana]MDZ4871920.1 hypothetical protein [Chroococcidiopsis cubana SAG 39.79]